MKDNYKRVCLNAGCGLNPKETTDEELWINIDSIGELGEVFKTDKKYKDKKIIFEHLDLDLEQQIITDFYFQSGFFKKYGKFDYVLIKDVFEHLQKPLKVMYDVWLACKPDALVKIECPYQNSHAAWSDIGHLREVNETMLSSLTNEFYDLNNQMGSCFSPHRLKYPFNFTAVEKDLTSNQGIIERISITLKVIKN